MVLSIKETRNLAIINQFYLDPHIVAGAKRDGVMLGARDHPAIHYLICEIDAKPAGFYAVVQLNDIDWEAHVCLMKWAIPQARDFGAMVIDWLWAAGAQRITVPAIKATTVNYCRRLGFSIEGVRRKAVSVNGARLDVTYLGLLRPEGE